MTLIQGAVSIIIVAAGILRITSGRGLIEWTIRGLIHLQAALRGAGEELLEAYIRFADRHAARVRVVRSLYR